MPRTEFTPENRVLDPTQFPRLKLEKDEKKRIVVIEKEPFYEFIHRLEMPQIGPNGEAIMTTKQRKDKSTYEVNAMDFVSQPLCLGDMATLKEDGVDPDNCPACAVAQNSELVKPPTRKYASHVLVYNTKPNSFEISEPFSIQCIIWLYSERRFNTLIDIAAEHEIELRQRDLCLGPCTNKEYQNYDIKIGGRAEWAQTEERQQMAKVAFVENRLNDDQIKDMLGKRRERQWIQEDLDKIRERWRRINAGPSVAVVDGAEESISTASLEDGLEDLLKDAAEEKQPESVPSLEDMADSEPSPETKSEEKKPEIKKGDEAVDFNDILGEFS